MVLVLARLVSIITIVPHRQDHIAMHQVAVLEMPQKTFARLAGECLLVTLVVSIIHCMVTIILLKLQQIPLASNIIFLLLCRASSAVARRTIRARAATSGLLLGALTASCTTSACIQAVSTPRTATVATTDSQ